MDYSKLSILELIDKIGNSRFWDLPSMLKEVLKKLLPQEPNYLTYTGYLNQGDTEPPIITVLENTLNLEIISTNRVSEGIYEIVFNKDFDYITLGSVWSDDVNLIYSIASQKSSSNSIVIFTNYYNGVDIIPYDGILLNTIIEIRIYN